MNNENFFSSVSLECKEECKEDFITYMTEEILPDTSNYKGNINVIMINSINNKNQFLLVGEWDSEETYRNYLQYRKEGGVFDKLMSYAKEEPVIDQYCQNYPVKVLEKNAENLAFN